MVELAADWSLPSAEVDLDQEQLQTLSLETQLGPAIALKDKVLCLMSELPSGVRQNPVGFPTSSGVVLHRLGGFLVSQVSLLKEEQGVRPGPCPILNLMSLMSKSGDIPEDQGESLMRGFLAFGCRRGIFRLGVLHKFILWFLHQPNLQDLTLLLGCEMAQRSGVSFIISQPHGIVHEKHRLVMAILVSLTLMEDEAHYHYPVRCIVDMSPIIRERDVDVREEIQRSVMFRPCALFELKAL